MEFPAYTIEYLDNSKIIKFTDPSLETLGNVLSSYIRTLENTDFFLEKLYYLRDNWDNIDQIVEKQYNEYFDEFILRELGLTGQWFMFWGWFDIDILVNKKNKHFCIQGSEYYPTFPVVVFSLDDFISILEQWRELYVILKPTNLPSLFNRIKSFFGLKKNGSYIN